MFIGDSITEGFAFNEILPSENVMAGAGVTAGYIYEEYMDDLAEKKPDNVFIMLGSDDMLMPVDDPKALFESDLTGGFKLGWAQEMRAFYSISETSYYEIKTYNISSFAGSGQG